MISLISVILGHKKLVSITTVAAFVISALVSLVLPPRYASSASFLHARIEQDITEFRDFFASLGSIGDAAAGFLRDRKNLFIDAIVRSRRMSDLLSEQFDLAGMYDKSDPEEVRKSLAEHTGVSIREEGVIVLSVEDRSPRRAKEMVEAYLANLDSILTGFTSESAAGKSVFLGEEIERRRRRLAEADSAIQRFQTEHRIYDVEGQAQAALQLASKLNAQRSMLEMDKQLLEMTLRSRNPEFERVKLELKLIEQQLREMKESDGVLYPSLDEFPGVVSQYIGLLADRHMQEFVLAYVIFQFEEARIAASRRTSVIKIIDPPFVPEKRAWPKRKQIVIVSTLVALFWTCFALLVREKWREGTFRWEARGGAGMPPRASRKGEGG